MGGERKERERDIYEDEAFRFQQMQERQEQVFQRYFFCHLDIRPFFFGAFQLTTRKREKK